LHSSLASAGAEGWVPEELSAWTDLEYFDVNFNDLYGDLSGLHAPRFGFMVGGNHFHGKLPAELSAHEMMDCILYSTGGNNSFICPLPHGVVHDAHFNCRKITGGGYVNVTDADCSHHSA
jgi:hypothetical protein